MRKLQIIFALILLVSVTTNARKTRQPGQPGPHPMPQADPNSLLQYFEDCLNVYFVPQDQNHGNFMNQLVWACPPLNQHADSPSNQLNEVQNAQNCVNNFNTNQQDLKGQILQSLQCAQSKVQASSGNQFSQKKRQSVIHKKLRL
ncbi:hypothetical protein TTHERM_01220400 (macronuclear) [Tetrahymena thermophila SB210]|uniref:Transmembrane protein n=1 Tax=Tetrahymena thermophila (strain SB210) TaxID=312017 RepID=Q24CK9_TETTS|nr:hypothetical protein TTHERM_01220400 [Tetrahymena thermophila SB210]EAS05520.1 hypothetical protein TTHERM_01220400 [Tetrahymena thermophila SB210]|eukprot:XP_001025765.1 hypothetical protein TTHERM_01220400 [Tetrahymena thermophila SB210]